MKKASTVCPLRVHVSGRAGGGKEGTFIWLKALRGGTYRVRTWSMLENEEVDCFG